MTETSYHFARATTGYVTGRTASAQQIAATREYVRRVAHIQYIQGILTVVRTDGARVYVGRDAISALELVRLRNHLQTV